MAATGLGHDVESLRRVSSADLREMQAELDRTIEAAFNLGPGHRDSDLAAAVRQCEERRQLIVDELSRRAQPAAMLDVLLGQVVDQLMQAAGKPGSAARAKLARAVLAGDVPALGALSARLRKLDDAERALWNGAGAS